MSDDDELIGRTDEQAALDQALAAIHHATGGIVLLAGAAGVGKTRLLEACLARRDLLVLKGQTNEIATHPMARSPQRCVPTSASGLTAWPVVARSRHTLPSYYLKLDLLLKLTLRC